MMHPLLRRFPLFLAGPLVVVLFVALSAGGDEPAGAPASQHIFVAGHSFHTPIAPLLDEIARSAGVPAPVVIDRQGLGGSSVTKHWELPDEKDKARKAIKSGTVDVLTVSPNANPLPDPAIAKFTALLLEHNPRGRVTVQASWVPFDGLVDQGKAFKNADRDDADPRAIPARVAPLMGKIFDQVKSLNQEFPPRLGRPVVLLVPVGDAVIRLRQRVKQGDVPGIARQSALFRDDTGHGHAPIYVLNAYCHYAVIFGRNPTGLPVPRALRAADLGENAERVNRILQEVAWQAVTAEPLAGVAADKTNQ